MDVMRTPQQQERPRMTQTTYFLTGAKILFAASVALLPIKAMAASTITIDGSSTVFPPAEAVAEEFQAAKKGNVRVTVGISGTGGGFKKFCRDETDISNASRPILKSLRTRHTSVFDQRVELGAGRMTPSFNACPLSVEAKAGVSLLLSRATDVSNY